MDPLFEGIVSTGASSGDGSFMSMSSLGVAVCIIPCNRYFFGHLHHNTPSPTLKSTHLLFFVCSLLSKCGMRREGGEDVGM